MGKWLHAFFNAQVFLTRIPAPPGIRYEKEDLNRATVFFPLIGAGVGSLCALVFWLSHMVWPHSVAVAVSMIFSLLLTGAFHEDGLADVCDAFGGGWEKNQILTIMKDSRIGTFGTVGLVSALGLKWLCLNTMSSEKVILSLIAAHSLSRWAATLIVFAGKPVPERVQEKPKPMATKLSGMQWAVATIFALGFGSLLGWLHGLIAAGLSVVFAFWLYRYYCRWIGGYSGDGLGTIQQVSELGIYLVAIASLW